MTLLSTVYTSEANMQRYLSSQAVIDFADHDDDGSADTGVVDDCINQATQEIDLYARQRYDQAGLLTSQLIERWATVMACTFLMQRRGNPPSASIQLEFNRITDDETGFLARIAEGTRQLPGVPLRADLRPTMSNVTIDRRHKRSVVRVTTVNSSDADTDMTQDTQIETPGVYD